MTKKRKTVGAEALSRLQNPDHSQSIIETQREMDKEYWGEIDKCVKAHTNWQEPYYIVIHQKKEKLLENVIRRYFIGRQSLPTPQWDQTVWRFNPKNGNLEFVWTLPDENTAKWLAANPKEIHEDMHELLAFTTDFLTQRLYKTFYDKYHKGEKQCLTSESSYADSSSKVVPLVSTAKSLDS